MINEADERALARSVGLKAAAASLIPNIYKNLQLNQNRALARSAGSVGNSRAPSRPYFSSRYCTVMLLSTSLKPFVSMMMGTLAGAAPGHRNFHIHEPIV